MNTLIEFYNALECPLTPANINAIAKDFCKSGNGYMDGFTMINCMQSNGISQKDKQDFYEMIGAAKQGLRYHFENSVNSSKADGTSQMDIKHRFYINPDTRDIYKFAKSFAEKCKNKNIPFEFKFACGNNHGADRMVIYSSTETLLEYYNIFEEMKKENPEMIERCGRPPILTARIDNWLGFGDEPDQTKNKESYNGKRSTIIKKEMIRYYCSCINYHKDKFVDIDTQKFSTKLHNSEKLIDIFVNNLISHKLEKFPQLDANTLKQVITKNSWYENALREMSKHDHINGDVGSERIKISNDGNSTIINETDIRAVISKMLPIIYKNISEVNTSIVKGLKRKYLENQIDPDKFCFNNDTRQIFESKQHINTYTEIPISEK